MADLGFSITATAGGSGKDREGIVSVDGQEVRFSVPKSMGGAGTGASPETLLLGAVTACFSLTLLAVLEKRRLPFLDIAVTTDGLVTGFPEKDKYEKITVNPSIRGADPSRQKEYEAAAILARDRCFIGQTVARGGVAYLMGTVTLA